MEPQEIEALLKPIGSEKWGLPGIVYEAAHEAKIQPWHVPLVASWETFVRLVDAHNAWQQAFSHAWPKYGVVPFAIGKGLTVMDAEEVSQETGIRVFRSMASYRPWVSAWNTWVLHVAGNVIDTFLRNEYYLEEERRQEIIHEMRLQEEGAAHGEKGWAVPFVCADWMSRGKKRAMFASIMLASFNNDGWMPPTGSDVAELCGCSRKTCYTMFRQFAMEVKEVESKGRFRGIEQGSRRFGPIYQGQRV